MYLLQPRTSFAGRIDGSVIAPDRFSRLDLDAIRLLTLESQPSHGNGECPKLGELFHCSELNGPKDSTILVGDCEQVDRIGAGMAAGNLIVLGNVGHGALAQATGGQVQIVGNAGDLFGTGLTGGSIMVQGNCGNRLGAPLSGKKSGMRGGDIVVAGNVGDRAFERMRRGTALVTGDVGAYAASQMIAGSLILYGQIGPDWGGGIRRGSLIFAREPVDSSAASWSEPRDFELSFLPLMWRHLRNLVDQFRIQRDELFQSIALELPGKDWLEDYRFPDIFVPTTRWVQRRIGDTVRSGQGESLVLRRVTTTH